MRRGVDLSRKQEVETVNEECGFRFGGFEEEVGRRNISTNSLELEINQRNRCKAFKEVLQSYDQLQSRTESLKEAKSKILRYSHAFCDTSNLWYTVLAI